MSDESYTNLISKKNVFKENECASVEIDGFLFVPDEVSFDTSYSKREYKRTTIMSGGEFVSRTTFTPKELSFKCIFDISSDSPDYFDTVFEMMVNKKGGCEIISPYCNKFNAEVSIEKTYPESSPNTMEVEVKLKEIASPDEKLYGDDTITYPSITKLSDKVVTISNKKETTEETTSGTDAWKQQLVVNYTNPYNTEVYTNDF